MSHDQKPGKMRVVGTSTAVANNAQRRRGDAMGGADVAPAAGAAGANAVAPAAAGTPNAAVTAAATSRAPMLLAGLFIAGCAIGGVTLPLLGVL